MKKLEKDETEIFVYRIKMQDKINELVDAHNHRIVNEEAPQEKERYSVQCERCGWIGKCGSPDCMEESYTPLESCKSGCMNCGCACHKDTP